MARRTEISAVFQLAYNRLVELGYTVEKRRKLVIQTIEQVTGKPFTGDEHQYLLEFARTKPEQPGRFMRAFTEYKLPSDILEAKKRLAGMPVQVSMNKNSSR